MPAPYDLYFWEPQESPHKAGLFAALQRRPEVCGLTQIAQTGLAEERRRLGWRIDDNAAIARIVAPDAAEVERIVATSPPDAIHIFSGMHWVPIIETGLKAVQHHGRRFGILSEPRAHEGLSGLARRAHSWLTEGALRRRASFVLAIGANGPPWFKSVGYDARIVFSYAYFIDPPPVAEDFTATRDGLTIAYVGRMTRDKGFQVFIDALPLLTGITRCRVAGAGELEPLTAAPSLGAIGDFRYLGVLAMPDVQRLIGSADILVQPSIARDGWNVVISEALLGGGCAVTTPSVGASVCLDDAERGRVVARPTAVTLAAAINDLAASGVFTPAHRARRRDWAVAHLSSDAGAARLLDVLKATIG